MKIIQFDPSSFQLCKFGPYSFKFVYFIPKFYFCYILVQRGEIKLLKKRTRERVFDPSYFNYKIVDLRPVFTRKL
jgi:hypothetical protein